MQKLKQPKHLAYYIRDGIVNKHKFRAVCTRNL
nr:MAG TPA: hypothetical protein [Caudoviricetes sp.]